jgi:putative ABC transport system permease protein
MLPFHYAVRNLLRSPLRLVLLLAGSALVTLLVLTASAFIHGMRAGLRNTGTEGNVVVLSAGSEESVERSEIGTGVDEILAANVRGIKHRLGVPYVSPEVILNGHVRVEGDDADAQRPAVLHGVTERAMLVHPRVHIYAGRFPEPGEVLVGKLAGVKLGVPDAALAPGRTITFDGHTWTISGRFEAPGTMTEAELWLPLQDLMIAAHRDSLSSVVLSLKDGADIDNVHLFVGQRLDLELFAMSEQEYYRGLAAFYRPVRIMVWVTVLLMGAGGFLGGLNIMYAAFAQRVRELGTLQALGFKRRALLVSLVQESVLVAITGALLAVAVGLLTIDGLAVRFSKSAFGMDVNATALFFALLTGLLLGLAGALPPAWRCLRPPIPAALRS